ncbi:MAG: carboxypeptidase-like regulatory domain-containing protein [Alistipes sp.]|nr:carboxypeptidase-like regulatory domain-containing protein [Alistipes sp.]
MKKFIVPLLLLAGIGLSHAQVTVNCTVRNAGGEPLGYATAYCPNNESGVAADAQGELSIEVESVTDTLQFSMLGYKPLVVSVTAVLEDPTVVLEPQGYEINEVVVTDINPYEPLLRTKTIKMQMAGSPGKILLVKVNNPVWSGRTISKIIAEKNPVSPPTDNKKNKKEKAEPPTCNLRCRVFAVGADGLPAHDLLLDNILAEFTPESEFIEVDLSGYDIEIPSGGMFVGFEWLPVTQTYTFRTFIRPFIKMTDSSDNVYTILGTIKGEWEWMDFAAWKKEIPFFISKKTRNAKIGIEVE